MISKIRDCRGRKCTTVLHGGVCHHTSTPHKSGNKMKEKKYNNYIIGIPVSVMHSNEFCNFPYHPTSHKGKADVFICKEQMRYIQTRRFMHILVAVTLYSTLHIW